jgi:hypothetical protein
MFNARGWLTGSLYRWSLGSAWHFDFRLVNNKNKHRAVGRLIDGTALRLIQGLDRIYSDRLQYWPTIMSQEYLIF